MKKPVVKLATASSRTQVPGPGASTPSSSSSWLAIAATPAYYDAVTRTARNGSADPTAW